MIQVIFLDINILSTDARRHELIELKKKIVKLICEAVLFFFYYISVFITIYSNCRLNKNEAKMVSINVMDETTRETLVGACNVIQSYFQMHSLVTEKHDKSICRMTSFKSRFFKIKKKLFDDIQCFKCNGMKPQQSFRLSYVV